MKINLFDMKTVNTNMINLYELGLVLIPEFITMDEEKELLTHVVSNVATMPPRPAPNIKRKGRNRIQRFGSSAPYKSNVVSKTTPAFFDFILDRLVEQKLVNKRPESTTINEYLAGQVIEPHIDSKASGEVVTVLCLLSEATMTFALGSDKESIILPPRSLVQLKNDLRHKWTHSIEPVPSLRYSVVFRCGD